MDNNEYEEGLYCIPNNYLAMGNIGPLKIRNIIEAVIVCLFVFAALTESPFILKIKVGIGLITILTVLFIFIYGIHNMSVTQFIITYIWFLIKRKEYLLAKPAKDIVQLKSEKNNQNDNAQEGERLYDKAKERLYDALG